MKISLLYKFQRGPYGGANQFLKAFKKELVRQNSYIESPHRADVILANANPGNLPRLSRQLSRVRRLSPEIKIILRIDGPISLVRGRKKDRQTDQAIARLVNLFADGIVFQSTWSKDRNQEEWNIHAANESVIPNAPDPDYFYPNNKERPNNHKLRLIITSWSPNPRKGFDIYEYIDNHINHDKYEVTFVGNSPIKFIKIRNLPPQSSPQLGHLLRQHDIYLAASLNDPCSNSLLEALSVRLPAVARNSGGHPELVGPGGRLFNDQEDVLTAIDDVSNNLSQYRHMIHTPSISEIARQYINFASLTHHEQLRQHTT